MTPLSLGLAQGLQKGTCWGESLSLLGPGPPQFSHFQGSDSSLKIKHDPPMVSRALTLQLGHEVKALQQRQDPRPPRPQESVFPWEVGHSIPFWILTPRRILQHPHRAPTPSIRFGTHPSALVQSPLPKVGSLRPGPNTQPRHWNPLLLIQKLTPKVRRPPPTSDPFPVGPHSPRAQSPRPGVHTLAAQAARRAARTPRPRSYGGDRSESEGAARSWRALPVAYAGRSGRGAGRGAGRSR